MPKVGQTSRQVAQIDHEYLYSPKCLECDGTGINKTLKRPCYVCNLPLHQVVYSVFEGLLKNQIQAGASVSYDSVKQLWQIRLDNTVFESSHLVNAVASMWNWRYKNRIKCVNLDDWHVKKRK